MIGLIPAAGTAERWGGYLKELLPVRNGVWLIDNCIETLKNAGCTRFIIVTNSDKIATISRHIARNHQIDVAYVLGGVTMWDSICNALAYCQLDRVIMSMPDTIVDIARPEELLSHPITFGTFHTKEPGRYSVFLDNGTFKKSNDLPARSYLAWGVVSWSPGVTNFFKRNTYTDFDTAFNDAMKYCGYSFTPMYSYYDIARFDDYVAYLEAHT